MTIVVGYAPGGSTDRVARIVNHVAVVTNAADHDVGASAAIDCVIARAAEDHVIAAETVQRFCVAITEKAVSACRSGL